jgi:hypothetical protein
MNEPESAEPESPEMRALDGALAATLRRPALPPGFEQRLAAALRAEPRDEWSRTVRETLERERLERLAELDAGYVRLRRRTLGTLIGAAFAAGTALTLAMPWLQHALGRNLPYVLGGGGALLGLTVALISMMGARAGGALARLLE